MSSHPWLAFLARRLARFVVSMFVLVSACFAMVHALPGDPVRSALGVKTSASVVAATRHRLGLHQSLWDQDGDHLRDLVTGHLGVSLISDTPVSQILSQLLPATVALGCIAFAAVVMVAIP